MAVMSAATGGVDRARSRFFDLYMVVVTLALVTFGMLALYSADGAGPLRFGSLPVKQFTFFVLGMGLMVLFALMDYRVFQRLAWVLYGVSIVLLLAVARFGYVVLGARRWFDFGAITLQPSELTKITVTLALAAFIANRGEKMREWYNFLISLTIVIVPAALVYREPDLGTALVFFAIWAGTMSVSKARPWYFLALVTVMVPAGVLAWKHLPDYQRIRLDAFLDPTSKQNIRADGFNIIQAVNSTSSGGLTGQGLKGGTLSDYNYLAVRTTDFIFAHAASMFGFLGCLALITLFLLLIWRYTKVIGLAGDTFGQVIAAGLTAHVLFQTVVNICMNIRLLPVTGVPLPFISYGGTALWVLLVGQGLMQSILVRHQKFVIG